MMSSFKDKRTQSDSKEIHKHLDKMKNWAEVTKDRTEWLNMEEAFILQWIPDSCL